MGYVKQQCEQSKTFEEKLKEIVLGGNFGSPYAKPVNFGRRWLRKESIMEQAERMKK